MIRDSVKDFLGDKYSPKSDHWLRQQVEWEHDPHRQHYLAFVRETMSTRGPGCKVLDYDCGTGWAGLSLVEHGFQPEFAGDGKCVEYLKFRLAQRGLDYPVHKLKDAPRLPLAVSFDSLLKHKEPWSVIRDLADKGDIVVFDLNERWPVIKGSTYQVDIPGLIRQIFSSFKVLSHKTYNHYAHLFAIVGTERERQFDAEENDNGE